jgi:dual specificity protein kinase CLK2/3
MIIFAIASRICFTIFLLVQKIEKIEYIVLFIDINTLTNAKKVTVSVSYCKARRKRNCQTKTLFLFSSFCSFIAKNKMSRREYPHLVCPEGTLIANRYRVISTLGQGAFAKVYKCKDTLNHDSEPVAVKIVKKSYSSDAKFEYDILRKLDNGSDKLITFMNRVEFEECTCFVFKLAGSHLLSRTFGISCGKFNIDDLRHLTRDLIEALVFLHETKNVIHTDLKPENILFAAPELVNSGFRKCIVADLGNASVYNSSRPDSDLIQTRQYRAPEVILQLPWCPKADIWSLGCILFEVYHGGYLFDVHDDNNHFHKIENRLGKFPVQLKNLAQYTRPQRFAQFFTTSGDLRNPATLPRSRAMETILQQHPDFSDLLHCMLQIDPTRRISAIETLQHPFLNPAPSAPPPTPVSLNLSPVTHNKNYNATQESQTVSRERIAQQDHLAPALIHQRKLEEVWSAMVQQPNNDSVAIIFAISSVAPFSNQFFTWDFKMQFKKKQHYFHQKKQQNAHCFQPRGKNH